MPRFYFHVFNDDVTRDEEGMELPDADAARELAIRAVRELICEEAKRGTITLSHHIEVSDGDGRPGFTVNYSDAVRINPAPDRLAARESNPI